MLKWLGVPDAFGVLLLTIGLVLALSPWCGGKDFGAVKVPEFPVRAQRLLRLFGPLAFVLAVVLHIPFMAPETQGPRKAPAANIEDVKGYVLILSPQPHEPITLKPRESLVVRGELKNIPFDTLSKIGADIRVEVEDPNSKEPLRQTLAVSPSLEWKIELPTLSPGRRNIHVTVILQDRHGTALSRAAITADLTKVED